MRTTVTLDPDTEQIVRERMAAQGLSFKRALNDVIRQGGGGRRSTFSTATFDLGEPRVDLTKATRIAGEMDDADLVQRLGQAR